MEDDALLDGVTRTLRERGERMTRPRRVVVQVMADHGGHMRAEEVLHAVTRSAPEIHRASVYRALDALSAAGVVQHVHVGHGATTYHLRLGRRDHIHAQCRSCGSVDDLPEDILDDVVVAVARRQGFSIDPGHVALSGICSRCRSD